MPKQTKTGSSYSGRTPRKISPKKKSRLTKIKLNPKSDGFSIIVRKEMLTGDYELQYSTIEEVLKNSKKDVIKILIDLVNNKNINDKGRALLLAGIGIANFYDIKNDYLNTLLIKIMKDESEPIQVRESAALALGKIGVNSKEEKFRKELEKIIDKTDNADMKASSIKSHIRVMGKKSESYLHEIYNQKDEPEVRKEIIIGFGIVRSRRALSLITNELRTSKNRAVEIACLEALGNIGTKISVNSINWYLDKHYDNEELLTLASIAWFAAEQNTSDIDTMLFV